MTDALITADHGDETDAETVRRALQEKTYGFWLCLISDAIIFALLFALFIAMARNAADGSTGHGLFRLPRIVAGTMLLLASSATFSFAIAFSREVESGSRQENASNQKAGVFHRFREAAKDSSVATAAGRRRRAIIWLGLTFMLGLGFIATEISQLHGMAVADAGPWQSGFLSAFFTLVSTHGAHVSLGLVWIALLGGELAWRGPTPAATSRLHRLGLFWHFLVIVWISIFALVYLPSLL